MPEIADPVVLLVEDEVLVRLGTADFLRERGFKVVEAATGAEAQSLLLAGLKPDVVFSDITMPGGVDGAALAAWLAASGMETPVVLASGLGTALESARAACPSVRAFLDKPYDYDALEAQLRALIAERVNR